MATSGLAHVDENNELVELPPNSGVVAGLNRTPRLAFALYDFAVNGGTIGAISLVTPELPDNAVVYDVNWDVLTTFTSATDAATIRIGLPGAGDMFGATAISAPQNIWDAGARRPAGAIVPRKLSSNVSPVVTIAVENLTGGKAMFCFSYWLSS